MTAEDRALFAAAQSAAISTLLRHAEALSPEDWTTGVSARRRPAYVERRPRPRVVHPKELGIVAATFAVDASLPEAFRHGVLQPGAEYSGLVRFSNAQVDHDLDADTRGMAVKLFVPDGPPAGSGGDPGVKEQDFVMATFPAFFVGNAIDYTDFPVAFVDGGAALLLRYFLSMRPWRRAFRAVRNLLRSQVRPASPLDICYHSQTPYALGPDLAVKLMACPRRRPRWFEPRIVRHRVRVWRHRLIRLVWGVGSWLAKLARVGRPGGRVRNLPRVITAGKDDVRDALRSALHAGPATFDIFVQTAVDEVRSPLDDATVVWSRRASRFQRVATLTIPMQTVTGRVEATARHQDRLTDGDRLSFSPGHFLPAHRPLGSINQMRLDVYKRLSDFRRFGKKPPDPVTRPGPTRANPP
jgi:hypothetical protein